jgi:hypothetical protein
MGAMTSAGATLAVLVMVLAPAASASTSAIVLRNASVVLDYGVNVQGCAHGSNTVHKFNLKTGIGATSEKAMGKACGAASGGYKTDTYSNSYTEFGFIQNYPSLAHNYSYINSSWTISALTTLKSSTTSSIKNCPYQTSSSLDNFYNGTGFALGWVNETYQNCFSEASVNIDPQAQVDDITSGQYWGFGFSGYYATAGAYADNYTETENFTTKGWTNATFSCTTCYGSFGAGGTTTVKTTVYGNVTAATYGILWSTGDHVQVYGEIFISTYAEVFGVKGATDSASIVASGTGGHVDLTSFSFT